jgi:hypothetical protein
MAQQQLLLIVLSVIIVGIAFIVGFNFFNARAEEANKDGIVSDCTNLGAIAQQYYKKPGSLSGAANTFVGWVIPPDLESTDNGTYTISELSHIYATITGTPMVSDYNWTVLLTVTPNLISTTFK